jgi:hypothetical protein
MDVTSREPDKRKIVVHYHIYKTAGSTIIDGLKVYFGSDNVLEVDKHPDYAQEKSYNIAFFEKLADALPMTMAFTAHRIIPNIHFSSKVDVYPIAFVRHPMLRANSVYRFEKLRKDVWPRKDIALKYDFAGWIDWCLDSNSGIEARNVQSRIFALKDHGNYGSELEPDVRHGNLPIVQKRLDAMPTVGVVEMFDLSLDVINRHARSYFNGFHIRNAQVNSTKVVDDWRAELELVEKSLPRALLDRFYSANAEDLALFERYRHRLEQQRA